MNRIKMKGRFSGAEIILENGQIICAPEVKRRIEETAAGVEKLGCGVFINGQIVGTQKLMQNELTVYALINSLEPMNVIEGTRPMLPDRTAKAFIQENIEEIEEIAKFNPYHGYHGYFSNANAAGAKASLKGKTENGQRLLDQAAAASSNAKKSANIDTIEEVAKYNHNHDARGRFSTAQGARSHDSFWHEHHAGEDVGDAAAQIKDPNRYNIGGKKNSLDGHIGSDGKLTPEREALHRKIIDQELAGKVPVEGQPTMTMLGGGPASGKSSVMSTNTADNPHAVTVDVDHFKEPLPGYSGLSTKDTRAADFYHEESSSLAKRFAEYAYQENLDVIYDGTGDGSLKSVQKKIDAAKKRGYKVEAKYVTIDTDEAVRRNQKRYEDGKKAFESGKADKPPRLVLEKVVRQTHAKCTDISVAMAPKFDHIEIWDNNGAKGQQKKIAEGGNGKYLKAVPGQEEAFRRYLSKGTKGINGFITLPDGQVVPVE